MQSLDPVAALHGDLAAHCLSFVGFEDLLTNVQLVSRAWRDAIDGGLPAVWYHEVSMAGSVTDARLVATVRKSHGAIRNLTLDTARLTVRNLKLDTARLTVRNLKLDTARLTVQGLDTMHTLSDIRSLIISFQDLATAAQLQLSSFPLLESIHIKCLQAGSVVEFPALQHLQTVRCTNYHVKGLHNLPSLTELCCRGCVVDVNGAWPASLREVSIHGHVAFSPQVLDRIAVLQHLVAIDTDWSFLSGGQRASPRNHELSFLPSFATLQRLSVMFSRGGVPPSTLFKSLGALQSLRDLSITTSMVPITDQDLQCLAQLTNLQDLSLSAYSPFYLSSECLHHVSALPQLRSISIHSTDLIDYSPISSCTQLRRLQITDTRQPLSLAILQAIAQLPQLEALCLNCRLSDASHFAHICTIRSLRELRVTSFLSAGNCAAPAFAALPALSNLHTLHIFSIKEEDASKFLDCLVQMPKLRHIVVQSRELSKQEEARVRDALPFLETLRVGKLF